MSSRKKSKKPRIRTIKTSTESSPSLEFVDEIPGRFRILKYTPVVEQLATKVGKPARIAFREGQGQANAIIRSLKTSASRVGGEFKFSCRHEGNGVAVYGVCVKK